MHTMEAQETHISVGISPKKKVQKYLLATEFKNGFEAKFDARFDTKLDTRFDTTFDTRLADRMDTKLDTMEGRLNSMDGRMHKFEEKQTMMEANIAESIRREVEEQLRRKDTDARGDISWATDATRASSAGKRYSNEAAPVEIRGWIADYKKSEKSLITWREVGLAWRQIFEKLDANTKKLIDKEGTESRAANGRVVMYLMEIHLAQGCNKQDSWKVKNAISSAQ